MALVVLWTLLCGGGLDIELSVSVAMFLTIGNCNRTDKYHCRE